MPVASTSSERKTAESSHTCDHDHAPGHVRRDDEHSHDHDPSHNHEHNHDHAHDGSCGTPAAVTLNVLASPTMVGDGISTPIRILQMDCPTEEGLIRKKLGGMTAVRSMEFNLMQRVLTVVHAPNALDSVLDALRSLGYTPEVPESGGQLAAPQAPQKPWWPLALAGGAAIVSEAASWLGQPEWLTAALAVVAIV